MHDPMSSRIIPRVWTLKKLDALFLSHREKLLAAFAAINSYLVS